MCVDGRCGHFTRPEGEDLDTIGRGDGFILRRNRSNDNDEVPDEVQAVAAFLGELLGARVAVVRLH